MNRNTIIGIFILILNSKSALAALGAKEIMEKNEINRRISDSKSTATLSTGAIGSAPDKIKNFTFWRKLQDNGVQFSSLTRFHSPAEVKNEGILITENSTGRNDVLLYLPNFKKIRRVESQQQSGSFMGSAFSYSDIATPHVSDYNYKLGKEQNCPTSDAAKIKCVLIESEPANDDVKERTGYSKSELWVRLDNFMMVKGQYYDLEGKLFKKMESNAITQVDAKNNKWMAFEITVENLKTREFTKLNLKDVKVNTGLSSGLFTQQNLQKVN